MTRIVCVVMVITLVTLCVWGIYCGAINDLRFEAATVTGYNPATDETTARGATGNYWCYYGKDDVGQKVVLEIHDKHTADYTDDEVVGVFVRAH